MILQASRVALATYKIALHSSLPNSAVNEPFFHYWSQTKTYPVFKKNKTLLVLDFVNESLAILLNILEITARNLRV